MQSALRIVDSRWAMTNVVRPRDGEQLALALAQRRAVRRQLRVIAVGQFLDERFGVGQSRGLPHLVIGGVRIAPA